MVSIQELLESCDVKINTSKEIQEDFVDDKDEVNKDNEVQNQISINHRNNDLYFSRIW